MSLLRIPYSDLRIFSEISQFLFLSAVHDWPLLTSDCRLGIIH